MASAIEVFCRTLNRHPSEVAARLDVVERLGRDLNAARMGITIGRLRNLKSLTRKALKLTGNSAVMKQLRIPLAYPWSACLDLFTDRRNRIALARLFRIMQLLGVKPSEVSPAVFEGVFEYLHTTGAARPDANFRELAISWNNLLNLLRPYRT